MKRSTVYLIILFLICCAFPLRAQITINEVCSRNGNIISDEDGDSPDWIELYNAGSSTVNLQGYWLSDDTTNLLKWVFPGVSIKPQSYITLFASDKDRKTTIDHWETVIFAGEQWRYIVPTIPVDSNWRKISFNDSGWALGTGGIGYGDGDDITMLSPPISSVFMRKTFSIVDTSLITNAIFNMDWDDAFVAYLNGIEFARVNVGITGTPPPFDELAYEEHEALMYQGMLPEYFKLDEQFIKTFLVNGTNVLAIQVHNINLFSSDMSAIPFLSFGIKDNSTNYNPPPTWFKAGWSFLHTNFKLSSDGETIYLSDDSPTLIDQISFPYMQIDNSYGSFPDGNINMALFDKPTPDSTNNGSLTFNGYVSDPVFSVNAGFYPFQQTTSLTCSFPSSVIRYTTNGSPPKESSPLFTSPIEIDSTMVIRARAFAPSYLPSEVVSNTYLIDDYSTLPVISISTHPDNLWDWNTGIYMLGPNADSTMPYFNANFWQNWEIPIHMEYFDAEDGSQQFEQDLGMKIHGGWSRSKPQKSFRILAKGKYGNPTLDYQLFPDKDIYSYKRFILRTSGNEDTQWNGTHFRDALMHKAVQENTFNDLQDYVPSVLYLNGKYWGIYNIREKISNYYLAENHCVDPDSVDLLQFEGYVIDGSNENYIDMAFFILTNDMADADNYEKAKKMLDFENFCDHFITETYYVNWDWPQNNIKYWRANNDSASKWRYILTDLDFGLGFGGSFTDNDLNRALNATNWGGEPIVHSGLLNALLKNITFRNYFINRYADLINTVFHPNELGGLAHEIRDSIAEEMPRHLEKWGGEMWIWNMSIDGSLMTFINNRQTPARDHIEKEFELNKQVSVTLNVYPKNAGKIKINTIFPDSLPWAGIYFDGVPISITALPNPGYEFSFWQSAMLVQTPDSNQTITLNVDTNDAFTAYFFGAPDTNRITINEINYRSSSTFDAGDWIELFNYGTVDVNISGWMFKDSNDANIFTIPNNTLLKQNEYIVLCRDIPRFQATFPDVTNVIGPFGFGLSNNGENLRLYDESGNLYLSMIYSGTSPWPVKSNGLGATLELLDPYDDLSNPYNWFDGCFGGSPGLPFIPCLTDIEDDITATNGIQLSNYPNPFTEFTTINFTLHQDDYIRIKVFDIYGREIAELMENKLFAGEHRVRFSSNNLAPGIYYCQVITSTISETRVISKSDLSR
ncbi:MAG: lamin tail domain-containing protein [Bacteroidota bacterium]